MEMQSSCDIWGTVLAPSDKTEKGTLRVKVKTMKDNMDTFDNVPVLTAYGNDNYGVFFLPEEGEIVRLTFMGGDFRHPVVTGCRFPADSTFVKDMFHKDNLNKGWKTKNGSSLIFSGEKGKDKIEIKGSEKMHLELDEEKEHIDLGDKDGKNDIKIDKKNGKATITAEKEIRLECGKSSLELKKDGSIVINCGELKLEAKTIEINGKSKTQIKGQNITVEGTTGISMNSKGQVKVESKGMLKLSGAMINLN